jgi:hypothetical protein
MRKSFTAVIERNKTAVADFATEPYEAAWAGEARWFVRVMEMSEGTVLTLAPQISPDGLFWCDEGHAPLQIGAAGLYSFPLREFGQWLRLQATVAGGSPRTKLMVYLVLKE